MTRRFGTQYAALGTTNLSGRTYQKQVREICEQRVSCWLVETACVSRCYPDTYPLPDDAYLKVPIAIALKVNDSDNPLADVRVSTPFGNGSSVVCGHSDAELFGVRFLRAPSSRQSCTVPVVIA
jgi:hypothetical protein